MILDLIALDNDSRVWIYQADSEFSYDQLDQIREELFPFLDQWVSHDQDLMTYGNVFHRRFLALFVDETRANVASGCSIDSSVRFVKHVGSAHKKDMFDRMTYCYMVDEEIFDIHHSEMQAAYQSGKINDETFFFDNLVKDKGQFLTEWIKPLKESWHFRFVK